jgi:short-subunit dehydrogenase
LSVVAEDGRVVVITGATGKLEPVVAARFARQGDRLALLARDGEAVEALAACIPLVGRG